jgi:hypothetical protein
MSAPIQDRPPTTIGSAARRDRPLVLLAASLAVAAVAVATGVAVASRTSTRPAMVATEVAAVGRVQPAGQAGERHARPAEETRQRGSGEAGGGAKPEDSAPGPVDTARNAAALPDGVHHALIRKVDVANDRITVDVVQRFVDDAAAKAAIADGKSRAEAEWIIVWLRNENPRLRSLPLAADLRVDFFEPCDEDPDRRAVLERLAGNARLGHYFYSLTVRDGAVHALKERQINPAC